MKHEKPVPCICKSTVSPSINMSTLVFDNAKSMHTASAGCKQCGHNIKLVIPAHDAVPFEDFTNYIIMCWNAKVEGELIPTFEDELEEQQGATQ